MMNPHFVYDSPTNPTAYIVGRRTRFGCESVASFPISLQQSDAPEDTPNYEAYRLAHQLARRLNCEN